MDRVTALVVSEKVEQCNDTICGRYLIHTSWDRRGRCREIIVVVVELLGSKSAEERLPRLGGVTTKWVE